VRLVRCPDGGVRAYGAPQRLALRHGGEARALPQKRWVECIAVAVGGINFAQEMSS
jgi:hypothetical protein